MHSIAGSGTRVCRRALLALLTLVVILGLQGCGKTIDAAQAQIVNWLVYKLHDKDPFTGTIRNIAIYEVISIAGNGACERSYKDGRLNGQTTCISDSGHKVLLEEWKAGRRDGTQRTWDPKTGNLHKDSHYKAGRLDGVFELYNPALGKRIVRSEYSAGELEGRQQVWDAATGETLLVDLMWHAGKQTGYSKWDSTEESFRDGKLHGTRRNYTIDDPQLGSALLDAQRQVEMLRGGGYFMGMFPGARVNDEAVYEDGLQVSNKDFTRPAASSPANVDACRDKYIASHRKQVGEDAAINADQIDEWESWCRQGKQPS